MLLDIVLPELNGIEVLEALRNPKNGYDPNLKILMFSNLNDSADRDRALELGANGFLSKTEFSPSQLVEEVVQFLKRTEAK